MKKFVAGIIVGATLMLGSTVFADQIKQYILTAASYPIFVNGKEFKDEANPILNYEGSTYVPLAKLGDLTGVNYKWNDALKRVEIDTKGSAPATPTTPTTPSAGSGSASGSTSNGGSGLPQGGILTPDVKIVESTESGFFTRDGVVMYEAFDRDGKRLGIYKDDYDGVLTMAILNRKETLPPKLSDGYMQGSLLQEAYRIYVTYDEADLVFKTGPLVTKQEEYYRLTLPADWKKNKTGETTTGGIRIKKYDGINYFNIEDLKKVKLIG